MKTKSQNYQKPKIKEKKIKLNFFFNPKRGVGDFEGYLLVCAQC